MNEIGLGAHSMPTKPRRADERANFISATGALRRLAIANFSTKMARLDALMEQCNGNTHVKTLNMWRERGYDANFIQDLTRGKGEAKARTAIELIEFLSEGSPPIRLACQEVLDCKVIEPLDKSRYRSHQKLIIAEKIPGNAFYLAQSLRALLIDARVMHAGLTNKAKSDMVALFNDPNSTFKVLIMMFDVGAVGLNLHVACNHVTILSLAKNRAQELQVSGRPFRVG